MVAGTVESKNSQSQRQKYKKVRQGGRMKIQGKNQQNNKKSSKNRIGMFISFAFCQPSRHSNSDEEAVFKNN
jgi:hypothetical protein